MSDKERLWLLVRTFGHVVYTTIGVLLTVFTQLVYKRMMITIDFSGPQRNPVGVANNAGVVQPGMIPAKPMLSVCMIVRDEEKVLSRCLKSVEGIADELIVVDTGSTDNTIIIAKDFDTRVFHFEWCDDFAAARNESLKHATGDWILQIDADEELLSASVPHVKDRMSKSTVLQYVITCDNGPTYPARRFAWVHRLFRNHPNLSYDRLYHEEISHSMEDLIVAEPRWQVEYEPKIIVRHYGYEKNAIGNKCERGLRMMKCCLDQDPNDDYILSKLGGACYLLGRYDEAEAHYKKALKIHPDWSEANFDLGLAVQKQGKLEEAIKCFETAVALDPGLVVGYVNLGAVYIHKGMLDKAISSLEKVLETDPDLALAHSYLGLAYKKRGMSDESIGQFKWAIAIQPDVGQAHVDFGVAYREQGLLDESIVEHKLALALAPEDANAHTSLGVTYAEKGLLHEAIKHCDKAMELEAEIDPQLLETLRPFR